MNFNHGFPSYLYTHSYGWNIRKLCRHRIKILICLTLTLFFIFCIGPIFFLPDFRTGLSSNANKIYNVYNKIKKTPPESIILPPPIDNNSSVFIKYDSQAQKKYYINRDKERLRQKINNDVIEKPVAFQKGFIKKFSTSSISPKIFYSKEKNFQVPVGLNFSAVVIQGGADKDKTIRNKRNKVVEMTLHAWRSYKAYAWGENELRPLSKQGHTPGIFGRQSFGATIVDALDTLYIMGLDKEYESGREWIANNLNFENIRSELSVFETNIRFVGGLLSLFAFTNDSMYINKAHQIATKLLPAFETKTGIPNALVNTATGFSKNFGWASGGSSILSEFGTLHLEFMYLSHVTGDTTFAEKVNKIREILDNIAKVDGLYPNYFHPKTGKWGQGHVSLGALGDSFYEYLLKADVQSGGRDVVARKMYLEAMKHILAKLLQTSKSGLKYFAEKKYGSLEHKMDHLACFSGGMLALGSHSIPNINSKTHMVVAEEITKTCRQSYVQTETGLGPESFRFTSEYEAKTLKANEKYYILRPEYVESLFYMWRYTHDQKYRDWAWDALMAIDKHCRVDGGFSGIKNVYMEDSMKDDVQQSFLFAETFKYFYLIFSDDSLIDLNYWVFNTEGHPLPIYGKNPYYKPAKGVKPWENSHENEVK